MTSARMAPAPSILHRLDAAANRALVTLGRNSIAAVIVLLLLCGLTYGPGFWRLPPVDRTEVIYAESSREMLEAGRLIDPRFMGERERHRPIGTFWAQIASARAASALLGPKAVAAIQSYRLPSLVAVCTGVLLVYLLLRTLIGGRQAFVAAGLFAVTPIAALQAQLGIAESLTLAPAVAAQLALLRLYAPRGDGPRCAMALLFWAALGVGITLNALLAPILSLSTAIALAMMDRDVRWLRRLDAWWGVPLMLLLGAPWIVALVMAEGGMPFSGLSTMDVLKALGGAQAMKFKAWPLTFSLGLLAGLMFCAPLLEPSAGRLWSERGRDRTARFLLAWLLGYLAYLELISSKPALYSVQVMLPAATTAIALALARDGEAAPLRWAGAFPAWPGYLFAAAIAVLYVAAQRLADAHPGARVVLSALPAIALLGLAARAAGLRLAAAWVVLTTLGAAVFLSTTFAVLLPSLEKGWTTEVIARATQPLAACAGGPVTVIGYREPSAVFTFRPRNVLLGVADWRQGPGVVVVEQRHVAEFQSRVNATKSRLERLDCLEAINVTRGCGLTFSVFVSLAEPSAAGRCGAPAVAAACGNARSHGRKPCS